MPRSRITTIAANQSRRGTETVPQCGKATPTRPGYPGTTRVRTHVGMPRLSSSATAVSTVHSSGQRATRVHSTSMGPVASSSAVVSSRGGHAQPSPDRRRVRPQREQTRPRMPDRFTMGKRSAAPRAKSGDRRPSSQCQPAKRKVSTSRIPIKDPSGGRRPPPCRRWR